MLYMCVIYRHCAVNPTVEGVAVCTYWTWWKLCPLTYTKVWWTSGIQWYLN